jgi:hypothetical protein
MPICSKGVDFLTLKITHKRRDARKGPSEKNGKHAM